jgi:phospholipid/cholesterol/gamma-HCH transport system substrate-binding protein
MSRSFRLGLFIVTTLGILAIGSFLIGERQFLFASTYRVTTTFKNVTGLVEGAEVRVGGIHKGIVKEIELPSKPGGDMTVEMNLERSTGKVLRMDSVASIQTEGLLGSKYVAISFGSDGAPVMSNGAHIPSEPPVDIPDLMKTAGAVLANVQEGSDSFRQIAAKINQGQGTVGALVNDRHMYAQLDRATTEAQAGATAFTENMTALKRNFFLRGFFNSRGYEDSTKLAQHEIGRVPAGQPVRTFSYDAAKIFADVDRAKLKADKPLQEAGRFLEVNPFSLVVVVAAYGMKGDADEIHTLTQARAMVVRDYLVNNFRLDDARVKTMGLGKTAEVSSDAGTVEIRVYPAAAGAVHR